MSESWHRASLRTCEKPPGDFFGQRALTGHTVRLEAATAVRATTVLSISLAPTKARVVCR
jgi:hypothetical protein